LITGLLSGVYGRVAARRRAWYAAHPERVRFLARPVVSVGNLAVGGTGKTPIVAAIARELAARGERPSILSRGYARTSPRDGVTVVSDGRTVSADVAIAGDEPLMLARALPGVSVLVGADRYLSGRLAETHFAATVHLLDDGFQYLALGRAADLLVARAEDLADRVLPAGRLREPLSSARAADAVLIAGDEAAARRVGEALGVRECFTVTRALGHVPHAPLFAVAAIARPQRFFDDLAGRGLTVTGTMSFRDHHPYSAEDVSRIAAAARASGAHVVATTEKDRVRLPADADGLPIAAVPLEVTLDPRLGDWLMEKLG